MKSTILIILIFLCHSYEIKSETLNDSILTKSSPINVGIIFGPTLLKPTIYSAKNSIFIVGKHLGIKLIYPIKNRIFLSTGIFYDNLKEKSFHNLNADSIFKYSMKYDIISMAIGIGLNHDISKNINCSVAFLSEFGYVFNDLLRIETIRSIKTKVYQDSDDRKYFLKGAFDLGVLYKISNKTRVTFNAVFLKTMLPLLNERSNLYGEKFYDRNSLSYIRINIGLVYTFNKKNDEKIFTFFYCIK